MARMAAKAGEASILELDQHPVTLRTGIGRGWAKLQNVRIKGLISASDACLCGQSLGDWIASFHGGTAPRPIAPALARSSPRGGNDRHDLPQGTLGHRRLEGNLGILHDREPVPILHRPEPGCAVIRCLTRLLVGGTQPQLELLPPIASSVTVRSLGRRMRLPALAPVIMSRRAYRAALLSWR
jgi:hypothetical protein